jgi:hypothetical protein
MSAVRIDAAVPSSAGHAPLEASTRPGLIAEELAGELETVRRLLQGSAADGGSSRSPTLDRLCAIFGLSEFERSLVLLCAGVELDAAIARACARGGADARPTFGLALSNLPDPHWSALAPTAPLRRWRLLRLRGSGPITATPLELDERILHLLAGVAHLDAELEGVVTEAPPAGELAPSRERIAGLLAAILAERDHRDRWPAAQLSGSDAATRRDVAALASARAGLRMLIVDAAGIPHGPSERADLARLCARESALAGAALLVETDRIGSTGLEDPQGLAAFATGLEAALVVSALSPLPGLDRAARLDLAPLSTRENRAQWRSALRAGRTPEGTSPGELNGSIDAVAAQFNLSPAAMRAATEEALRGEGAPLSRRLWDSCRTRARPPIGELAERIISSARWEQLVIPAEQRRTLEEIAAQVRWRGRVYDDWGFATRGSRGLGITALFAGASGTGKTMAAEVLANALGLDLYRLDLSSVVSKYIGETEKNLRRVFDAAEGGGAVLLFDEADALFGKRTEVKDSHDRFANIEISYLLQRMEAYRGLAVLTTNQRREIDEAFLRRLRFVVEFPFPETAERIEIWRRAFPREVPTDGLRVDLLAQLAIAGGNIRNVALGAAFLAADDRAPVRMTHVLRAARTEYAKLERSLTSAELGGWP